MKWQKDMERMVSGWTDMQQRMWDSWMDSVKQFSQGGVPQGDWQQAYERNLEAWERSVQEALDAQKVWARKWSEAMGSAPDAPEAARAYSEQVQSMMQGWTESQRQLWSAWFESVRDMDPQRMSGPWEGESRQVMEAWQQAAERARETLENWARSMPLADLGSGAPPGAQRPAEPASGDPAAESAADAKPADASEAKAPAEDAAPSPGKAAGKPKSAGGATARTGRKTAGSRRAASKGSAKASAPVKKTGPKGEGGKG
jgi:hypothetical protein